MDFLITIIVIIYVFSPHDLMCGPIDDIIVILIGNMLKDKLSERSYR
jgi:uncharacterized membrane protein YkvA (DUF1232 family)